MDTSTFLTEIFHSDPFTTEELNLVFAQFQPVSFKKHEFLIESGASAPFYYFLESGFARAFAIDTEGNEVTTNFFDVGDILIDWRSFFLKTPCQEYVQATAACTAWRIYFEDFMKLFHIEAFREVGRTRLVNNYFDLKSHTVSMITDEAKDRYLNLIKNKPNVLQYVPLKHIATYLGVTDTSLSRIRKEIAKENRK